MKLGCDPELFLLKNGKLKSICGMLGDHDKWNPMQLEGLPQGCSILEDNVALEFNTTPATTEEEFVKYIKLVKQEFLKKYQGFKFSSLSFAKFPDEELQHPGAHIFGCEPDFNAWTGEPNPKIVPPSPNARSAGGHIHVETSLDRYTVVRAMDLYLGVPSVLMDRSGAPRRLMYGKAGAFRPKDYGVEYRTLGNFWTMKDKTIRWAWQQTERALSMANNPPDFLSLADEIQEIINNNNVDLAKDMVKHLSLEVV